MCVCSVLCPSLLSCFPQLLLHVGPRLEEKKEQHIADGKATYRNRWIETRGLLREREEGKALWGGFNTIGKVDPPLICR